MLQPHKRHVFFSKKNGISFLKKGSACGYRMQWVIKKALVYFDKIVFLELTWWTDTAKINSCNICQCIDTIFSSEYFFFFHNSLISDDVALFLFKDLT